jgi:hypothetical protein
MTDRPDINVCSFQASKKTSLGRLFSDLKEGRAVP